MKNKLFSVLLGLLAVLSTNAQTQNPHHQWLEEARFGLFVHFGISSVLCEGEWVMNTRRISGNDYRKLQTVFNPDRFNAAAWVRTAKEAGMKYITFTSRHHDSFSNWDTRQSDWSIMHTPYGKDIVRQLADECHRQDVKLVLYYSLLDWMRDDYSFSTGSTGKDAGRTVQREWDSYVNFMKAQLTELLTNYGEIAGIWFDGEWDQLHATSPGVALTHEMSKVNWHFDEIYNLIHGLQPNCMIANNHHLAALPGEDYQAFEKDLPGENTGGGFSANQSVSRNMPLETCETMNGSWGYNFRDNNFKSTRQIIHLLVRSAGYGANLLLNVGPQPTGEIQEECLVRLKEVGQWTSTYGQTIYGTKAGFIRPQSWGAITQKGKTYYVHILNKESGSLTLALPAKIQSARWLNVEAPLAWKQNQKTNETTFSLDVPLNDVDAIMEITVK